MTMAGKISYWVFTSGEQGIHGLDWGVKFSSEQLGDMYALDVEYRALLKDYSLNPGLKRPADGVGLILLPSSRGFILGFIFPGTDHGGRLNTSTVLAVITRERSAGLTVNEAVRTLWGSSDIAAIAQKNSRDRPDFLNFGGEVRTAGHAPEFSENVTWPEKGQGWLQADGNTVMLTAPELKREPITRGKTSNGVKIFAVILGAVIALGGGFMLFHDRSPEPEDIPPANTETEEAPKPYPKKGEQPKDKANITEGLRKLLGDKTPGKADKGFQFRVSQKDLNIDDWREKKTAILGDNLALHIQETNITERSYRIIFELPNFDVEGKNFDECISAFLGYYSEDTAKSTKGEQTLMQYKATIIKELRELLGSNAPVVEQRGFYFTVRLADLPIEEWREKKAAILGDNLASHVTESSVPGRSYRIVFILPQGVAGKNFDECISEFLDYYTQERYEHKAPVVPDKSSSSLTKKIIVCGLVIVVAITGYYAYKNWRGDTYTSPRRNTPLNQPGKGQPAPKPQKPDADTQFAEDIYSRLDSRFNANSLEEFDFADNEDKEWRGKILYPLTGTNAGFINPDEFAQEFGKLLQPDTLEVYNDGRAFQADLIDGGNFNAHSTIEGLIHKQIEISSPSRGIYSKEKITGDIKDKLSRTRHSDNYGYVRFFMKTNRNDIYLLALYSLDPNGILEPKLYAAVNDGVVLSSNANSLLRDIEDSINFDSSVYVVSFTMKPEASALSENDTLNECLKKFVSQFGRRP